MMANPIPTLGYPSRRSAIIGLSVKGWTDEEIAKEIGLRTCTVHNIRLNAAGFKGVVIPADIAEGFQKAALRRNVSESELAYRLLKVIVLDNLVESILDDGT